MPTFNFDVDDAALLKAYKISSLTPSYVSKKTLYGSLVMNALLQVSGKK